MKNKGFTLLEIIVVISIIGLVFSVILPVSYDYYVGIRDSIKVYKLAFDISKLRRESFLYSKPHRFKLKDRKIFLNEELFRDDLEVEGEGEIIFYRNGTSNGGEIVVRTERYRYIIKIKNPDGEVSVEKS